MSAPQPPAPAPPPLRYLALGDSYTIGAGVAPGQRWPVLLAERLRAHGLNLAPPTIIAQTGWTTAELLNALKGALGGQAGLLPPYDLASLLIGVNNQYRRQPLETYRQELGELLQFAIRQAGGRPERVLVLSIPDWSVTPFAAGRDRRQIAAEVAAFNTAKRRLSQEYGVRYVDITPLTQAAGDDPSMLVDDGLHPSGAMYARWADAALDEALAALGKRSGLL